MMEPECDLGNSGKSIRKEHFRAFFEVVSIFLKFVSIFTIRWKWILPVSEIVKKMIQKLFRTIALTTTMHQVLLAENPFVYNTCVQYWFVKCKTTSKHKYWRERIFWLFRGLGFKRGQINNCDAYRGKKKDSRQSRLKIFVYFYVLLNGRTSNVYTRETGNPLLRCLFGNSMAG